MKLLMLFALLQDPVDDLLQRLSSDDIETRATASRDLVAAARKSDVVRKRLEAEAAKAAPELKAILGAVLVDVEWSATGKIPVGARSFWRSVGDEKRFVAWGGSGRTDGALFEQGEWKALPAAEIIGRVLPTLVLSGDHLVVWSGATNNYLADGAVYDLKTLKVRTIPDAPIVGRMRSSIVELGGGRLLFWGGAVDLNSVLQAEAPVQIMWRKPTYPNDGAILDLATLTWTKIADAPFKARLVQAQWTGKAMVVVGGSAERTMMDEKRYKDGAAYDPATDAWKAIEDAPLDFVIGTMVTEQGVLAYGLGCALLTKEGWSKLPDPPVRGLWHAPVKGRVLVWNGVAGSVLDVATKSWRAAPKCPLAERVYAAFAWDGENVRVCGGWAVERPNYKHFADGASWKVGAAEWTKIAPVPLDMEDRRGFCSSSAGRFTVIWGGATRGSGKGEKHIVDSVPFRDAAIYDGDRWRTVPSTGPLVPWMASPAFVWLEGRLLIVADDLSRAITFSAAP